MVKLFETIMKSPKLKIKNDQNKMPKSRVLLCMIFTLAIFLNPHLSKYIQNLNLMCPKIKYGIFLALIWLSILYILAFSKSKYLGAK